MFSRGDKNSVINIISKYYERLITAMKKTGIFFSKLIVKQHFANIFVRYIP